MPITRKALAVANKVLEFIDHLSEAEREDVITILMDTFQESTPDLTNVPVLNLEDIASRLYTNDKPQIVHSENIDNGVAIVTPPKRKRTRRISPYWKKAKPETLERIANLPRKVHLTHAQQRALKRNLLAIMEQRDLSNYKISSMARKAGYQVSHGTVGNMTSMKYQTYTQMTLQAVAAAVGISVEQLTTTHA